jgi:hypothetical protein
MSGRSHPYFVGHLPENRDPDRHHEYAVHWVPQRTWVDGMQILRTYTQKTLVQSHCSGIVYALFPVDLCEILLHSTIEYGYIVGRWCYVNHNNYGVKRVSDEEV